MLIMDAVSIMISSLIPILISRMAKSLFKGDLPKIYELDLPKSVCGVCDILDNDAIILVNSNLKKFEKQCIVAEETCHYKYFPQVIPGLDRSAYQFVKYVVKIIVGRALVSDSDIESKALPYLGKIKLKKIANNLNVTKEILGIRVLSYYNDKKDLGNVIFLDFITKN